jgi:hypothetical protein
VAAKTLKTFTRADTIERNLNKILKGADKKTKVMKKPTQFKESDLLILENEVEESMHSHNTNEISPAYISRKDVPQLDTLTRSPKWNLTFKGSQSIKKFSSKQLSPIKFSKVSSIEESSAHKKMSGKVKLAPDKCIIM